MSFFAFWLGYLFGDYLPDMLDAIVDMVCPSLLHDLPTDPAWWASVEYHPPGWTTGDYVALAVAVILGAWLALCVRNAFRHLSAPH